MVKVEVTMEVGADGVAIIKLTNPLVNALAVTLLAGLKKKYDKAMRRNDVKAIVVTGNGGKFSGGFDFNVLQEVQQTGNLSHLGRVSIDLMINTIKEAKKPSVAAIQGLALGGGLELVMVHYFEDETKPTGTCAFLIVGGERSMVVNLLATNCYKSEHLKSPENWALVEKAKFCYIAGFFLAVSPESIQLVAEHAAQKGKIFMMNLASPYICECFTEAWMKFFPYMDYVFGDETEARTFAKAQGWETDNVEEIALKMSALPKATGTHKRIAVIPEFLDLCT